MDLNKDYVIFTYSIRSLTNTNKIRFFYALKGRNSIGILKETSSIYLAKSVLLVPINSEKEIEDFFNLWRIPFKKIHVTLKDSKEVHNV